MEGFLFVFGLLIGSFLNVCIYRLPQHQSIVTPPSHCNSCGTRLVPRDLIPVISYFLSAGRCRHCGAAFSARYAMVEGITACIFLWCLTVFGFSLELIRALSLSAFLLVITFIDYDYQLILDNVLLWMSGLGIIINVWMDSIGISDMCIAVLLGGGLFLLIAIVSRGGMGAGDIKFVAALGIWLGWKYLLVTMLFSFVFGGLGGLLLLALGLKTRKDCIPFGPFIALSAFLSLLYGQQILAWYIEKWY